MRLSIQGLTPKQKVILQQLWDLDNLEKVNTFVAIGGPEVQAMRDLLVAEVLDQRTDIHPSTVDFLAKF